MFYKSIRRITRKNELRQSSTISANLKRGREIQSVKRDLDRDIYIERQKDIYKEKKSNKATERESKNLTRIERERWRKIKEDKY